MKKVLVIFGTRPEAIKFAPVIKELERSSAFEALTCVTAQHRDMLDQALRLFGLRPNFDLDLMRPNQDLFTSMTDCLQGIREIMTQVKPDLVLVQGDTTTAFAGGLAAFYSRIKLGHVEAGLRTYDKHSPFPEEVNRAALAPMVDYHFAPTSVAAENLLREGVSPRKVFVTGNTSIDALLWAKEKAKLPASVIEKIKKKKMILLTAHRRENFGSKLRDAFKAIADFLQKHEDYYAVYPVHKNPNVSLAAQECFQGVENISLLPPVNYLELVALLKSCHFVVTDSGGLQEEAPTFGKPVLVLRETTERAEAVRAGCALLVGQDPSRIKEAMEALSVSKSPLYSKMSHAANPFGNGTSAKTIVRILEEEVTGLNYTLPRVENPLTETWQDT